MRRSASRSRHMEGEISFGAAVAIGPRLVVRTDDGELNNLVLDAILGAKIAWCDPGEDSTGSPQYFTQLLASVARAAAADGPPLIDLGRGNPEVGPPPHVVERLAEVAGGSRPRLPAVPRASLRCARRSPSGTGRCTASTWTRTRRSPWFRDEDGTRRAGGRPRRAGEHRAAPRPGLPDYPSGWRWQQRGSSRSGSTRPPAGRAVWAKPLATTSRPCTSTTRRILARPPRRPASSKLPSASRRRRTPIVHDFAYGDLMFDRRSPESFLATPGARGRRRDVLDVQDLRDGRLALGFVLGNAEIVGTSTCSRITPGRGSSPPSRRRDRGAQRPAGFVLEQVADTRRGETASSSASEHPGPTARLEGLLCLGPLPDGVTVEGLLAEARVALAPGEGFGATAPAGRGCRSR